MWVGGSLGLIIAEVQGGGEIRVLAVLFLIYVSVSGMRARSQLSSQPLMIPASWVILRVEWSITLFPPWVTASHFLT